MRTIVSPRPMPPNPSARRSSETRTALENGSNSASESATSTPTPLSWIRTQVERPVRPPMQCAIGSSASNVALAALTRTF